MGITARGEQCFITWWHNSLSDRLAHVPQCLCEIWKENWGETLPWFSGGQADTTERRWASAVALVSPHEAWLPVSRAQHLETIRCSAGVGGKQTWRIFVYLMWGKWAVLTLIDASQNLIQTFHKRTTAANLPCRGCQQPFSVSQRSTGNGREDCCAALTQVRRHLLLLPSLLPLNS